MTCLLWLPSKPQSSYKVKLNIKNDDTSLYLIPLFKNSHILVLYRNQIIQLDAAEFEVIDEILLENPIEEFKFDPEALKLTLKLSEQPNENMNTSYTSDTSLDKSEISTISNIVIVTSKRCTWSFECSYKKIILNFSTSGLVNCIRPSNSEEERTQFHQSVLEVIKNGHVASLIDGSKLQILNKSCRSVISSVSFPENSSKIYFQSLIWIGDDILVFRGKEDHLQVLKYSLIQSSSPTNGCNWPLVTWSNELINVHRAGAICPSWYKLKHSEIWDVLSSPVGKIKDVQVSFDGSCLVILGLNGVAICDFNTRNWKSLPFPSLIQAKWLGNDYLVAMTHDNQQLVLIPRIGDIMIVPFENASAIKFIDTYNHWQVILQTLTEICILGFNYDSVSFTLIKRFPFESKIPLKQATFMKENIFTLDQDGNFLVENDPKIEGCESYLVLETGHFLINMKQSGPILWKDDKIYPIDDNFPSKRILGVLPFTNCLTLLHSENLNFSLHSPISSQFLLPDLFVLDPTNQTVLSAWKDDPLYQLALEYILLKSLNHNMALESLDRFHQTNTRGFSLAIVSLSRKIEHHEISLKLFPHLPTFSPLFVSKNVELNDALNFLPYLAKSYFENVNERKDTILFILNRLFSKTRIYHDRITKIKEYLSAFADLYQLFLNAGKAKIELLWKSGRFLKAFALIGILEINEKNPEIEIIPMDKLEYFKIEKVISPKLISPFWTWLETQSHPESVINALKES